MRSTAWGVDLTGGAVRAVHVERRGRRYRILDAIEQPVSGPGEGAEPLAAHLPDGVARALTDLVQARRSQLGDPLFVALPVFGARHGRIEVALSAEAQVEKLLEFELHQALGGDLEPWLVRRLPVRDGGRDQPRNDYFAQRRELVQSFVADLGRAQLPYDGLVPGPLALARYAELEWPGQGRHLLIECQRTRTDLLWLLPDGQRRWRSLPLGCGALADAPVGATRLTEAARLGRRLREEQRESHRALFGAHDGTPIQRIVLLGEAARHEELRRALEQEFEIEVATPRAPRVFSVSPRAAPFQPLHHGTALGLALAALDGAGEPWNMIEPPRARRLARALPALSCAAIVVAAGLLATHFIAARELAELRTVRASFSAPPDRDAHRQWEEACAAVAAANERGQAIAAAVAAADRLWPLPRRLLAALAEPPPNCRLLACSAQRGDAHDLAELRFEVAAAPGDATAALTSLLRDRAGINVTGVQSAARADGTVELILDLALPTRWSAP